MGERASSTRTTRRLPWARCRCTPLSSTCHSRIAILMPLIAAGFAWALWTGRIRPRAWLTVVAFQALLLGSGLVATRTGEAEEERVENVVQESALHHHEELADQFVWAAGLTLGTHRSRARRPASGGGAAASSRASLPRRSSSPRSDCGSGMPADNSSTSMARPRPTPSRRRSLTPTAMTANDDYNGAMTPTEPRAAEIEALLRVTPVFRQLAPADRLTVAAVADIRRYDKGDAIFEQGAPSDVFYSIASGRVKIFKTSHVRQGRDPRSLRTGRSAGRDRGLRRPAVSRERRRARGDGVRGDPERGFLRAARTASVARPRTAARDDVRLVELTNRIGELSGGRDRTTFRAALPEARQRDGARGTRRHLHSARALAPGTGRHDGHDHRDGASAS